MNEEEKIDPGHRKVVKILRIAGFILFVLGGVCILVAFINLIGVIMDGASGPPRLFWLFFIGIPLSFFGLVMISAGFAGKIARFQAAQYAPVAKDTFNYMAEGTQEGVKTIAKSITQGMEEGKTGVKEDAKSFLKCPACGFMETPEAKFCSGCGPRSLLLKQINNLPCSPLAEYSWR